jgi:hypothetical protein
LKQKRGSGKEARQPKLPTRNDGPGPTFQIEFPKGTQVTDLRNERPQRSRSARAAPVTTRKSPNPKRTPKPVYDPFADAGTDVVAALKTATESKKRVLIEFGANWCPGCRDHCAVLKENSDVSAALNKSIALVLVDIDADSGQLIHEKYVPKRQRHSIPNLAVLDSGGKVLKNDDATAFEDGDDYDVSKVKTFLAEWSPSK